MKVRAETLEGQETEKTPDERSKRRRLRDKLKKGQTVQDAVAAQPKTKKAGRLIVRNLSFDAAPKHLKKMFGKIGVLRDAHVPMKEGEETKKKSHPGFGFVEFEQVEDAAKAIEALSGKKLCGRPITVAYALQKGVYERSKKVKCGSVPRLKQKLGDVEDDSVPVEANFEEEKQRMKRLLDGEATESAGRNYDVEATSEDVAVERKRKGEEGVKPEDVAGKKRKRKDDEGATSEEVTVEKRKKRKVDKGVKPEDVAGEKREIRKANEGVTPEDVAKEKRKKRKDVTPNIAVRKDAEVQGEGHDGAEEIVKKRKSSKPDEENEKKKRRKDASEKCGHDLGEGKTIFIRNVPYDAQWTDVKSAMEKYGQIARVYLCKKDDGGHKGTGFVKFEEASGAQNALKEEAGVKEKMRQLGFKDHLAPIDGCGVMVKDRRVIVMEATAPSEAPQRKETRKAERRAQKESWSHLLSLGSIDEKKHPEKWALLSKAEKRLRQASHKERTFQRNDPNYIVNPMRLSIRNLDLKIDAPALTKAIAAAGHSEGQGQKIRPKKVNLLRSKDRKDAAGMRRSLGYAFADFGTHEEALATLQYLNNNADALGVTKRPIVEFAMEDKRKLRILENRQALLQKWKVGA